MCSSDLEGANKAYGTLILASESTTSQVREEVPMRRVDRIRVKGKQQPVDVFTPCADAALVTLSEQAWQAFLARDWDGARQALAGIRATAPEDALAALLEERIAAFEAFPPPEEWDGSVSLEKL